MALKRKVQDLMKVGYVSFDYNAICGPNVTSNPLPNHPRPKINALTECIRGIGSSQNPSTKKNENDQGEERNGIVCDSYCQYHDDLVGHTIQDCAEFRKKRKSKT